MVAAIKLDQQNNNLLYGKKLNEKLYILLIRNHFRKILFPNQINSRSSLLIVDVLGFYIFCSQKRKKKLRYLFNHNCRKPR
jgi:hypothetical protein